jgi:hypothetical protein
MVMAGYSKAAPRQRAESLLAQPIASTEMRFPDDNGQHSWGWRGLSSSIGHAKPL